MIQIKQTILTLVALLAVTAQAWAQGKLIYEKDFSSDASYPFYLDAADKTGASATISGGMLVVNNPSIQATNWDVQPEIGRPTSAITQGNTYRVVMQYKTTVAGSVTFVLGSRAYGWPDNDWSGQTITVSNDFQTCEAYFDSFPYNIAESHILLQFGELVGTITIKKVEVYELYPFDGISWTASTKTATIAEMPAGNVLVTPEYYPQAAFAQDNNGETPVTLAPTANNSAKANTDDPLVEGGTVANIVEGMEVLDAKQGTLLYHVSTTQMNDAQLAALTADDWNENVPTADGYTFDTATDVYVYYYIKGVDDVSGNAPGSKFTFSDTEIQELTVNVQPEPTYTLTFDPAPVTKATVTIDDQAATPDENGKIADVKANSSVKLNANDGYMFKKVKVKKGGGEPVLLTTITAADNSSFKSGSQTFGDVATVTLTGNGLTNDGSHGGWYCLGSNLTATISVAAANGANITSVKFYTAGGGSAEDKDAPFEVTTTSMSSSDITTYLNGNSIGSYGVSKIEVYGTK